MNKLKLWFKQLTCQHAWALYEKHPTSSYRALNGVEVVQACKKCGKRKKGSDGFIKYD